MFFSQKYNIEEVKKEKSKKLKNEEILEGKMKISRTITSEK